MKSHSRRPDGRPSPRFGPRSRNSRVARRGDEAGFTLLELLVVVTIMVGLAAALGTVALNFLGGARADTARLQMQQVAAGLDLFRLHMGRYPTEAEGLTALVAAPDGASAWRGPYVKDDGALTDPWGNPLAYSATGGDFTLVSLGADGAEGGEGDAADVRL